MFANANFTGYHYFSMIVGLVEHNFGWLQIDIEESAKGRPRQA